MSRNCFYSFAFYNVFITLMIFRNQKSFSDFKILLTSTTTPLGSLPWYLEIFCVLLEPYMYKFVSNHLLLSSLHFGSLHMSYFLLQCQPGLVNRSHPTYQCQVIHRACLEHWDRKDSGATVALHRKEQLDKHYCLPVGGAGWAVGSIYGRRLLAFALLGYIWVFWLNAQ